MTWLTCTYSFLRTVYAHALLYSRSFIFALLFLIIVLGAAQKPAEYRCRAAEPDCTQNLFHYKGNAKKIVLPSAWEDLSTKQFILTIVKLLELLGRQIKINEFRLALLLLYTGYKPGADARIQRWQVLKSRLKLCCVFVKYFTDRNSVV